MNGPCCEWMSLFPLFMNEILDILARDKIVHKLININEFSNCISFGYKKASY